ncbi:MAG: endonuclease/exonuclease/phosphatase family protein [Bacteroidota bacterium]
MPITVATWNMQGGINFPGVSQLSHTFGSPNVICLQETGDLESRMTDVQDLPHPPHAAGSRIGNIRVGRHTGTCIYWPNDAETRLGVAIICMVPDQLVGRGVQTPSPAARIAPRYPRGLPWVEVRDPGSGRSIRIYSIHAPSAGAARASNWSNAQITGVSNQSDLWAVVGDFNADPDDHRTEEPVEGVWVSSPNATQQSGNTLDYLIANTRSVRIVPATGLPMSDHFPEAFIIHLV